MLCAVVGGIANKLLFTSPFTFYLLSWKSLVILQLILSDLIERNRRIEQFECRKSNCSVCCKYLQTNLFALLSKNFSVNSVPVGKWSAKFTGTFSCKLQKPQAIKLSTQLHCGVEYVEPVIKL